MRRQVLAVLSLDEINGLNLAVNKMNCAGQALRPDAVPVYAPEAARINFFREAIFAYADAQCLQDFFWQDLAKQYAIATPDVGKLAIDFQTNELLLRDLP